MSLYDGLDIDTKPDSGFTMRNSEKDSSVTAPEQADLSKLSGWSSSYKFMTTQLQRKKAAQSKLQAVKAKPALAPVLNLANRVDDLKTMAMPPPPIPISVPPLPGPSEADTFSNSGGGDDLPYPVFIDEYNPLKPNDYEKLRRARERQQRQRDLEDEKNRKRSNDDMDGESLDFVEPPPKAPAEPSLGSRLLGKASKGHTVASAIMAKYGYKEGQGLGKKEQGISTALSVQKTSKRGGKIIAPDAPGAMPEAQRQPASSIVDAMKNPSKVVLLRNMVGPGEVDDDLQPETAEECSKYGEVVRCLIYEIPDSDDPEEAVRIFVQFTRMESAIKAVVDLNGRYFGGRTVKAGFFDEDRFDSLDLAP